MRKILLFILCIFLMPVVAHAADASISGPSSITNGSNVTVNVNLNSVAAWNIHITSSGATSGCSKIFADVTANGLNTNKTLSVTCKATSIGNISFSVSGDITSEDGNNRNVSLSKNITVIAPREKESENRLQNLYVDNYELNIPFNSDTYEYSISVPTTESQITINASAMGRYASINGTGTYLVSEDGNSFVISVTAENGSSKEYKLNILIIDPDPIEIEIDNKKYTVVKTNKKLVKPEGYEESTIQINDLTIPSYKNDVTKFIIVGIKDENGNIKYAIYENNNYRLYNEVNSNNLKLYISEGDLVGLEKIKTSIDDTYYDTYKLDDRFVICYAMDISSGKYNYYKYDTFDKTFQYYEITKEDKSVNLYFIMTIVFGILLGISICVNIYLVIKRKRDK